MPLVVVSRGSHSLTTHSLTHCKRLCLSSYSLADVFDFDRRFSSLHDPSIHLSILPGTASPSAPRSLLGLAVRTVFRNITRGLGYEVCLSGWPYSLSHSFTHSLMITHLCLLRSEAHSQKKIPLNRSTTTTNHKQRPTGTMPYRLPKDRTRVCYGGRGMGRPRNVPLLHMPFHHHPDVSGQVGE